MHGSCARVWRHQGRRGIAGACWARTAPVAELVVEVVAGVAASIEGELQRNARAVVKPGAPVRLQRRVLGRKAVCPVVVGDAEGVVLTDSGRVEVEGGDREACRGARFAKSGRRAGSQHRMRSHALQYLVALGCSGLIALVIDFAAHGWWLSNDPFVLDLNIRHPCCSTLGWIAGPVGGRAPRSTAGVVLLVS